MASVCERARQTCETGEMCVRLDKRANASGAAAAASSSPSPSTSMAFW